MPPSRSTGDVGDRPRAAPAAGRCRRGRGRRRARRRRGVAASRCRPSASARRSASQTPPRSAGPTSTTPSRPWLRSTISWAMRVMARRTSSASMHLAPGNENAPVRGRRDLAVVRDGRSAAARICSSSVRASRDPLHGRRPPYRRVPARTADGPPTNPVRPPFPRSRPRFVHSAVAERGHERGGQGHGRPAAARRAAAGSGVSRRGGPSVAMAESMPLTKRPESSVEKRLASSTASSITTAVGTSGRCQQLVDGDRGAGCGR